MTTLIDKANEFKGHTLPNPTVAAAVYDNNTILSIGVHSGKGNAHAEVEALKPLNMQAENASIMVTLEPCTHYGSTPPCVEAIINAGISSVVFACRDPFNK